IATLGIQLVGAAFESFGVAARLFETLAAAFPLDFLNATNLVPFAAASHSRATCAPPASSPYFTGGSPEHPSPVCFRPTGRRGCRSESKHLDPSAVSNRAAANNHCDQPDHEKHEEQNLGDTGGSSCDSGKAENGSDDCDD